MNKGDRITLVKQGTLLFMGATVILCLVGLVLWLFGVPGVQNEYARGWLLGLQTLANYFVGCCVLGLLYFVAVRISRRFPNLERLTLMIVGIFWFFFIYTGFNLFRAFQIMAAAS
ncbi:hypothetical protein [Lyngbya sp. CCY1209]|uniref:hypothetical protein n=1 Tax=Lyngbya sp. CCY1209 TaxID=2886103 RepID=UPI002D20B29C|nr:hypothetical protein [Lyngbya sp. CCY1209]MEB3882814.1 hypothetical protein [Lyngbya sp. CCY1209]